MKEVGRVIFCGWNCAVLLGKYENGRHAIRLIDADDGEPVATATINMPEVPLLDDMVIIKDYSENAGILDVLSEAGIVAPIGIEIEAGRETVPLCYLNPKILEEAV